MGSQRIKIFDFGFLGALTLLFIGLKLTGHISWSWLFILSPIWAIPAILIVFSLGVAAVMGVLFVGAFFLDGIIWGMRHYKQRER